MRKFKDHFSKQSEFYKKSRPPYPKELFEYLQDLCDTHDLAWDCGTGNGQTAIDLVQYFSKVYASDLSAEQLKLAAKHPSIEYHLEQAEDCNLSDRSVDLITVSQALHWFNLDKFYQQVKRVLKKNGIIAIWTYNLPYCTTEIDKTLLTLHDDILKEYWKVENRDVERAYSGLVFPFKEVSTSNFVMKTYYSLNDLLDLLRSWSAVQRYITKNTENPINLIRSDLQEYWPNQDEKKLIQWKLNLKIGTLRDS